MARGLGALAAWALFAFGGVHLWAAVPLAAGALLAFVLVRPSIARGRARALDVALLLWLAAAALHLVPLPAALVGVLSPASLRLGRAVTLDASGAFQTLSIQPSHTAHSLLVLAATLLVFWTARETFRAGGIRTTARGIALFGFVASALALLQSATSRGVIYWSWRPEGEGPEPFGPFVNRNHFAGWMALAIPLCLGYLAARASTRDPLGELRPLGARLARAADSRTLWLLAATASMAIALAATLSRSGLVGVLTGLAFGRWLTASSVARSRRRGLGPLAGVALVAAAVVWNLPALAGRFERAAVGYADRLAIWRETLPMLRDFWTTGSGLGTFETTMVFYQQSDRTWFFNQAHNEYLQLATEGGLLVLLPAAAAAAAFLRLAAARLREDRTGMFWIRAGAAAGLAGLAVQSLFENGMRMPANAALAAILAAILIHEPHRYHPTE